MKGYNTESESLNQRLMEQSEESDQKELNEIRKKIAKLSRYVHFFDKYQTVFVGIQENQAVLDDKEEEQELKEIAAEEIERLKEEIEELNEDVVEALIPESEMDERDCTLEVRSAMGGSESTLFSEELANMY